MGIFNEYIKKAKKVENIKDPFILIQEYSGFGNKVFNIIIGIYLKYKYKYYIYFVDTKSKHTKKDDPEITTIFPRLKNEFIFIDDNEGDYLGHILDTYRLEVPFQNVRELGDLDKYFTNYRISLHATHLYNLVFDMYYSFDEHQKKIFKINRLLIDPDVLSFIKQTNYAAVHIRYGDKLKQSFPKKNEKYNLTFVLYTPKYYYNNIKKINMPVIILTDSPKLVDEFIIKRYNVTNAKIIDTNFLNSFYLLLYSNICILSHSTFSYCAYLMSQRQKEYVYCGLPDMLKKYGTVDCLVGQNWKIINTEKCILNFDLPLLRKMYEYYLQHK